ncbi:hypothetical protein HPB50_003140 [Hyalomma asiaticum]|uniref:Uncharacterized protein n=1 Tax=Hyalomma asiaticum TaxID=266040 RepID=A0ACB7SK88_HYAAI|nr:hypothetical protein HPB50_003140 [Hyalomma asiaticum]
MLLASGPRESFSPPHAILRRRPRRPLLFFDIARRTTRPLTICRRTRPSRKAAAAGNTYSAGTSLSIASLPPVALRVLRANCGSPLSPLLPPRSQQAAPAFAFFFSPDGSALPAGIVYTTDDQRGRLSCWKPIEHGRNAGRLLAVKGAEQLPRQRRKWSRLADWAGLMCFSEVPSMRRTRREGGVVRSERRWGKRVTGGSCVACVRTRERLSSGLRGVAGAGSERAIARKSGSQGQKGSRCRIGGGARAVFVHRVYTCITMRCWRSSLGVGQFRVGAAKCELAIQKTENKGLRERSCRDEGAAIPDAPPLLIEKRPPVAAPTSRVRRSISTVHTESLGDGNGADPQRERAGSECGSSPRDAGLR